MTPTGETTRAQTESIAFDVDLHHPPEKVWRAKLSYAWVVGDIDTIVTFTLTPTASGTRLSLVQSGFTPQQKRNVAGARYGWNMMGGKLVELLGRMP